MQTILCQCPAQLPLPNLLKTPAPQGHACANCGSPVDEGDKFCNVCGAVQDRSSCSTTAQDPRRRRRKSAFSARTAGRRLRLPPISAASLVRFAIRTTWSKSRTSKPDRQPPEFVDWICAHAASRRWKNFAMACAGGMFRPGDLSTAKIEEKLRGVYLPFWSFSMLAQSQWSAKIGEHWYADRNLHHHGRWQAGDADAHRHGDRVVAAVGRASQLLQRLFGFRQPRIAAGLCRSGSSRFGWKR